MSATTAAPRKPSALSNRRSVAGNIPIARSPTPSRENNKTSTPEVVTATGTAQSQMNRRHTIREGPNSSSYIGGHSSSGSISSLRTGLSARSAVKRQSVSGIGNGGSSVGIDEAELLERDAQISDLRHKVARLEGDMEHAASKYHEEIQALRSRAEEAVDESVRLEDLVHSKNEQIYMLEGQVKDFVKAKREKENIFESERYAWNQEKEELIFREQQLNMVVQKLKDDLTNAQKEIQREREMVRETQKELAEARRFQVPVEEPISRRSSNESYRQHEELPVHFAPPSAPPSACPTPPISINNTSNLLFQKDKIIQDLKMQLLESEVKLADAERMGGSKVVELERDLMECRMQTARLMEDNESLQLMLTNHTLTGDFSRGDFMTNARQEGADVDSQDQDEMPSRQLKKQRSHVSISPAMESSLAAELENVDEEDEDDYIRRLESEIKQHKEQMKALNEQNKALLCYISNIIERILKHKDYEAILDKTPQHQKDQEEEELKSAAPAPPPSNEKPGFLARTRSLVSRRSSISTTSPSPTGSSTQPPSPINKPVPALPVEHDAQPLLRSQSTRSAAHKRSQSDAPIPSNFLGKQGQSVTSGPDNFTQRPSRSRNSIASSASVTSTDSGEMIIPGTPASSVGSVGGGKLRPLRLVEETEAEEAEKKRREMASKRSSWMGSWFTRGGKEEDLATSPVVERSVVFERRDE